MTKPTLVSVKLTEDTRRILRVLAAHLDVNIYEVAEALCRADMERRKLVPRTGRKKRRVNVSHSETKYSAHCLRGRS